jgi:general secretion pathway protein I
MNKDYRYTTKGFTLLEIMVALVILAIALSAASFAISRNAQNATYIDQKTAAHWVAMNVISKQQLKAQQPNFNDIGDDSGQVTMLNHTWYWKSQTETVAVDHTYRISVDVSDKANGPSIDHLEGYLYHVTTTD